MKYISDEPFPRYFNQPLKRSVFFLFGRMLFLVAVYSSTLRHVAVYSSNIWWSICCLWYLSLSAVFSRHVFFFFQLLSSVLARKIMWFSRDAPVVYLHGIQCKLLIFSLWCFNSDFQMINSTKEEISRFWASVTFELFAFISIFSWSRRLTAWTPVPSRRF